MSDDIRSILDRLAMVEGNLPTNVARTVQDPQQKSMSQTPALFKPVKTSLGETMQGIEEDMLGKVKRTFVDYLEQLEDNNKIDPHLVRRAKHELDIANDPENESDLEEDPTQQDFDIVPAQAPAVDPTPAEAPVKTYPMEDGSMLECYGDNDRGFEIRHNGRKLPTRFPHIDHADMAVKLFQKRRQRAQAPDQDYMEEH